MICDDCKRDITYLDLGRGRKAGLSEEMMFKRRAAKELSRRRVGMSPSQTDREALRRRPGE